MKDLSPLERRLFDWLSRRSDSVLILAPFGVFVIAGALGVWLVSAIAHRSPLTDTYSMWLIASVAVAGSLLYTSTFYALAVFFIRTRRFKLLELHQTMRDLQAMSWREFEDLVAAYYYGQGYDVEPRGGDVADGGIDVIVRKDNKRWIVQCKHYKWQWIEERPLRELLGVVTANRADGGIFVTCGVFDDKAMAFAKASQKLELIAGEQLRDLIASARGNDHRMECPKCGSSMRQKSGRYGEFLSCINYPACDGSLPIGAKIESARRGES
jgi:restriction system protein